MLEPAENDCTSNIWIGAWVVASSLIRFALHKKTDGKLVGDLDGDLVGV